MKKNILIFAIIFGMLLVPNTIVAETTTRSASFTTSKGTTIALSAEIENAGVVNGKPSFVINSTYTLKINVSIGVLGAEVLDFHDIGFEISIVSDSLLGDDLYFYTGYYLDSSNRFLAGDSYEYEFDIFISGNVVDKDAKLKITLVGKENIEKNRDPTSTFEAVNADVVIVGGGNDIVTGGNAVLNRSMEVFTGKETKLRLELFAEHEGLDSETTKPTLLSDTPYSLKFRVTVLELGADARDFHDVSVRVTLDDTSITDVIPGNSATKYYGGGYDDGETRLVKGEFVEFTIVMYAATNINSTDVTLNVKYSGKEDTDLIDPSSDFSLSVEFLLNNGISNVFDSLRSNTDGAPLYFPVFFIIFAIPVLRKKILEIKK